MAFRFNIVYRCNLWSGSYGGAVRVLTSNITIDHNIIFGNFPSGTNLGAGGLEFGAPFKQTLTNITARNNIVFGNGGFDVQMWGSDHQLEHNLIGRAVLDYSRASLKQNNLSGLDPKFVSSVEADFHIRADSPARNAGKNIGYRFKGSAPDMGVFEYDE
jgi:hypothetical protein